VRYECPSLASREANETTSNIACASVEGNISIGYSLILLNLFSCVSGLCFKYIKFGPLRYSFAGVFLLLTLATTKYIARTLVLESNENETQSQHRRFRTPLVPYLPALGIYVNWFLMAHIGWVGMVMLVGYVLGGVILYGAISSGRRLDSMWKSEESTDVSDLQEELLMEDHTNS
jgi:hypothetical protein